MQFYRITYNFSVQLDFIIDNENLNNASSKLIPSSLTFIKLKKVASLSCVTLFSNNFDLFAFKAVMSEVGTLINQSYQNIECFKGN